MTIKSVQNGWKVDIRPEGSTGKRVIRKFSTKAEATRFEAFVIAQATAGKEWNPKRKSNQRLSDFVALWSVEHGATISSGQKYQRYLERFSDALRNPVAHTVTSADVSRWRSARLNDVAPSTTNLELTTIKSFFAWLIKHGHLAANPAETIGFIRTHEKERPFLSKEQIKALYAAIDAHYDRDVATIAQICLETGCRWGEAQGLTQRQIKRDRLIFTETKGKKTRTVPIDQDLRSALKQFKGDRLFRDCEQMARIWLNETLSLPKGISTHILRHTFASHFIMGGGNILTLQRILGHSKIEMTMRYAHLSPEHLEDARRLNPRAQMERMWK